MIGSRRTVGSPVRKKYAYDRGDPGAYLAATEEQVAQNERRRTLEKADTLSRMEEKYPSGVIGSIMNPETPADVREQLKRSPQYEEYLRDRESADKLRGAIDVLEKPARRQQEPIQMPDVSAPGRQPGIYDPRTGRNMGLPPKRSPGIYDPGGIPFKAPGRPGAQGAPIPGTATTKPGQATQGVKGQQGAIAGKMAFQPGQKGPMTGPGWYGAGGGTQAPQGKPGGRPMTEEEWYKSTPASQVGQPPQFRLSTEAASRAGRAAFAFSPGEPGGIGQVQTSGAIVKAQRQARFEKTLQDARQAAGIVNPEEEKARQQQGAERQKQEQAQQQRAADDIDYEIDRISLTGDADTAKGMMRDFLDQYGDRGILSTKARGALRNWSQGKQAATEQQFGEKRAEEQGKEAQAGYEHGYERRDPQAMDRAYQLEVQRAGGDPDKLRPEFRSMYDERQQTMELRQAGAGGLGQAQDAEQMLVAAYNEIAQRLQGAQDPNDIMRMEETLASIGSGLESLRGSAQTLESVQRTEARQPWEVPGAPEELERVAAEQKTRAAEAAKAKAERISYLSTEFDERPPEAKTKYALTVLDRDPDLLPNLPKITTYLDLLAEGYNVGKSQLAAGAYGRMVGNAKTLLYGTKYQAEGQEISKPAIESFELKDLADDDAMLKGEWSKGYIGLNKAYTRLHKDVFAAFRKEGLSTDAANTRADETAQEIWLTTLRPHGDAYWVFVNHGPKWAQAHKDEKPESWIDRIPGVPSGIGKKVKEYGEARKVAEEAFTEAFGE